MAKKAVKASPKKAAVKKPVTKKKAAPTKAAGKSAFPASNEEAFAEARAMAAHWLYENRLKLLWQRAKSKEKFDDYVFEMHQLVEETLQDWFRAKFPNYDFRKLR